MRLIDRICFYFLDKILRNYFFEAFLFFIIFIKISREGCRLRMIILLPLSCDTGWEPCVAAVDGGARLFDNETWPFWRSCALGEFDRSGWWGWRRTKRWPFCIVSIWEPKKYFDSNIVPANNRKFELTWRQLLTFLKRHRSRWLSRVHVFRLRLLILF